MDYKKGQITPVFLIINNLHISNVQYKTNIYAMKLNIAIIYGSVRSDRQGIKAANFFVKKLNERKIENKLVDPLKMELPMLDKMYKEYSPENAPAKMKAISNILNHADGFLIITGEYNHSIPPALKNILDHFQREFFFKPSAIVSYSAGNFGGVRAAVHLRAILGELGTPSISSMFPITHVDTSFDMDGNAMESIYEERSKRFLDELIWYTEALKAARIKGVPY
jgi:NAD(P)H-dependent FMN reductase